MKWLISLSGWKTSVPSLTLFYGWKVNSGEDRFTTRWTPKFVKSTPSAPCWDRLQFHVCSSCSSRQEVAAATFAKWYPSLTDRQKEWYRSLVRNEKQCFSEIWNRIHPHVLEYQDEHLWGSFHQSQGKTVSWTMNLFPGTTLWQRIHTRRELLEMHLRRTFGRQVNQTVNQWSKGRRESELSSCFSARNNANFVSRRTACQEQQQEVYSSTARSTQNLCMKDKLMQELGSGKGGELIIRSYLKYSARSAFSQLIARDLQQLFQDQMHRSVNATSKFVYEDSSRICAIITAISSSSGCVTG